MSYDGRRRIEFGAGVGVGVDYDVPVRMTDGTVLAADVFRPSASGRYPVILVRTPYDKLMSPTFLRTMLAFDPLAMAREGYVVVIQDVRGTGASEGRFRKEVHEAADGADSIAWAAAQEWSNGSVGMAGPSYLGTTQLNAAIRRPPALKLIMPSITWAAHYEGAEYQGGAFQLGRTLTGSAAMAYTSLLRHEALGEDVGESRRILESITADPRAACERLPLTELPRMTPWLADYGDWLAHPDRGGFGRETAINEHYGEIDVPAVHIGGWYDVHLKGTLDNYVGLRDRAMSDHARANQWLIVTPWAHAAPGDVVGDVWLGPAARALDFQELHLEFFAAFLKGESPIEQPPVRIFVMGANRWREEDRWPPSRAVPTRFHLRSDGGLTREPPGDESPDRFVYDPRDPVPTVGGNTLLAGAYFMGPRDRRTIRRRPDVLGYETDVLTDDVEVTGPVTACLQVATSAPDTDFTVTLVDVHPDGRALGIADGILRLRYRDGFDTPRPAEPGRVHEIEVDLLATSNVFKAGHRIGVEVSSSNFPRFDRNPNHGGVIAEATEHDLRPAVQHVFHDAGRASYITLPLMRTT